MQLQPFSLVNISVVALTFLIFVYMAWKALEAFRKWQFKPLVFVFTGMLFLGISSLVDIMFRYSPADTEQIIMEFSLRGSGLLFYLGAFLVLRGILGGQAKPSWDRMMIYAMIYSGMCVLYILPGHSFVVHDVENGMWFITSNTALFPLLNFLTSIPALEIIAILGKKEKSGHITPQVRRSLNLLYFGLTTTILGSTIIFFLPNQYGAVLSNISFTFSVGMIIYAFTRHPLFLSFSHAKLYRIILVSTEDTGLALAYYDWIEESSVTAELTSAAICGTSKLIDEITRRSESEESLSLVQLESNEVVIERSNSFACYLIAENTDKVCRAAMRRVVHYYEQQYGTEVIDTNQPLPQEEFRNIVESAFVFSNAASHE